MICISRIKYNKPIIHSKNCLILGYLSFTLFGTILYKLGFLHLNQNLPYLNRQVKSKNSGNIYLRYSNSRMKRKMLHISFSFFIFAPENRHKKGQIIPQSGRLRQDHSKKNTQRFLGIAVCEADGCHSLTTVLPDVVQDGHQLLNRLCRYIRRKNSLHKLDSSKQFRFKK